MNTFKINRHGLFAIAVVVAVDCTTISTPAMSDTISKNYYSEIEDTRLLKVANQLLKEKKRSEAHKILSLLAKRPNIQVQFEVAKIRSRRLDELQDTKSAIKLFKYILSGSSPLKGRAAFELARIYKSNPKLKKQKEAIEFFQLAASHKNPKAYAEIAHIYANGVGVEKDIIKALRYYELAAKHQSAAPVVAFARYLARTPDENDGAINTGKLVDQHYAKLVSEATGGYAGAAKELARLHLDGDLKSPNITLARKWLRQAVIGGDIGALRDLALLELNNSKDKRNLKRSLAMLKDAADSGSRAAKTALSRLESETKSDSIRNQN